MRAPQSAKAWNAGTYANQDNMQRVVPEKWQAQAYWWLRGYDGHSWELESQPTRVVVHVTEAQRREIEEAWASFEQETFTLNVSVGARLAAALRAAGILKD